MPRLSAAGAVQSRAVEQRIMEHPSYSLICRQQEDERCHAPASFATVIYSTGVESGKEEPLYDLSPECAPPPADPASPMAPARPCLTAS